MCNNQSTPSTTQEARNSTLARPRWELKWRLVPTLRKRINLNASLRVPQATRIISTVFVLPTEMECISPETNGPGVLGSSLSKWRRCITQQCLLYVIATSCHFDNDSGERIHNGAIAGYPKFICLARSFSMEICRAVVLEAR